MNKINEIEETKTLPNLLIASAVERLLNMASNRLKNAAPYENENAEQFALRRHNMVQSHALLKRVDKVVTDPSEIITVGFKELYMNFPAMVYAEDGTTEDIKASSDVGIQYIKDVRRVLGELCKDITNGIFWAEDNAAERAKTLAQIPAKASDVVPENDFDDWDNGLAVMDESFDSLQARISATYTVEQRRDAWSDYAYVTLQMLADKFEGKKGSPNNDKLPMVVRVEKDHLGKNMYLQAHDIVTARKFYDIAQSDRAVRTVAKMHSDDSEGFDAMFAV